ncbi:hypothetical protein GCM10022243_48560 [Saccharothrix violaceirubra]|uniref:DUF397 domain-containing protein n=1 Tax=Saccharothrix violaceirubra TaxID=413306 RepID=A0A7W7SZG5_9PSEU|nr:DUF397 domain-containing protein [Saccharothrix violaceirubra]MBB4963801.1 hypothetical protein [Saccharothrix violaceirubra]
MPKLRWKKSSKSGSNTGCVEISNRFDAVRDSKNPGGPALEFPAGAVKSFVAALRQS